MAGPQYTTNGLNFMGGQPPPQAAPTSPFGRLPTGNDGMQPPTPENGFGGGGMNFMQTPKGPDGNPFAQPAPAPQPPGAPNFFGNQGGNPGVAPPPQSLAGQFGQLHPQVQNMLRSIPPQAMDQLTRSGLIHPGLMNHLRGGANGTDNGRQEDRGQEGGGMQPPQFGGGRVNNGWSAM